MLCINAEKLKKLSSVLNSASSIVLLTHTHPDGDAIGSVSAMWHYLNGRDGRRVTALFPESIPGNLRFICRDVHAEADTSILACCDLLVCLDFNNLSRTGLPQEALDSCSAYKVLVDHHLNPALDEFDLVFSETQLSSASELLYWILKALEESGPRNLPLRTLECLTCGMTTDTNNFANSTFPSTLRMASEMLEAGVDRDAIVSNLLNSYRVNRIEAISYLLDRKLVVRGGLAYIVIGKEDLDRFHLEEGELEGLVNIPLSALQVKMSITAKEDEGKYRISVRSKKGWSANGLASTCFHGGGHEQASGGKLIEGEDYCDVSQIPELIERSAARFVQL